MFYEVRANLYFTTKQIPDEIKAALLKIWSHTQVVNPLQPNQECSVIEVLKNHHDSDPNQPCELIFHKDNCPVPPEP